MKIAIGIFARKPELGKVKTRLAAKTGDDFALDFYQKILTFTINVCKNTSIDPFLFVTPEQIPNYDLDQILQVEGDLGFKMLNAIHYLLNQEYDAAIIIGTDCPTLDENTLNIAVEKLKDNDIVIGPATDGGYYLIGMKKVHFNLFENMPWSTDKLYHQTIEILNNENLSFYELPEKADIDEWDDLIPFLSKFELVNPTSSI